MFCGAAAQAAIGLGLNLFIVGILASINPVFVPGPVLVHSFLLSLAASIRLRGDIDFLELATWSDPRGWPACRESAANAKW